MTKGQASPRSDIGFVTKTTPRGAFESPLSVCETAIAAGATFVAQGYMINRAQLVELIQKAMDHKVSPSSTYSAHVLHTINTTAMTGSKNIW